MPILDKPLPELQQYRGTHPKPAGFDEYWQRAVLELDATPPSPVLEPTPDFHCRAAECFDLWFQGVGGARIYAKFLRPRGVFAPMPAILEFHGYSASSGEWSAKLKYVAEGFAVAALDCRGQGGRSEDVGGVKGNTLHGHIIRGLDEGPEKLLFRSIFLDTVQLARVVRSLEGIDGRRISVIGGSQGGALAVACAALDPGIHRCVSIYPFLSDFQRVWEMDMAKDAYGELREYFRRFDPLHERQEAVFHTLGFIDVHHLAPRVQAEVLMGLSLMDSICPPSTQFAVFNNLQCPKRALIYPDFGHEGLPGLPDEAFQFLVT